jgi:predicted small lipoprotein YifL
MIAKPQIAKTLFLLGLFLGLLSGCGQRGPLFLPEPGSSTPASTQPESVEEDPNQVDQQADESGF